MRESTIRHLLPSMCRNKSPRRLEEAALEALANGIGRSLANLLRGADSSRLRNGVDITKDQLCGVVCAEAYNKLVVKILERLSTDLKSLENYYYEYKHGTDWLDVILNERLESLELWPNVSENLMTLVWTKLNSSFNCLRKLRTLRLAHSSVDWSYSNWIAAMEFASKFSPCTMENLTTFVYPRYCTDVVLNVISAKAPHLQVIDIHDSPLISKQGVPALQRCSRLRALNVENCVGISSENVESLLSTNEELQAFTISRYRSAMDRPSPQVYPRMRHLCLRTSGATSEDINRLVRMFPNLSYLDFEAYNQADLREITVLKNLTCLKIRGYVRSAWKPLLASIGSNLHTFGMTGQIQANDLKFIRDTCRDLCVLEIVVDCEHGNCLFVPYFQKLRKLSVTSIPMNGTPSLDIGRMSSLESLDVSGLSLSLDRLKSILMDSKNFPKLKEIIPRDMDIGQRELLRSFVRNNNLDLRISEDGRRK